MWRFFERYPKDIKSILLILFLQQFFFHQFTTYSFQVENSLWSHTNFLLINGMTLILGGIIADILRDSKKTLKVSSIIIFTGALISLFNNFYVRGLGILICQISCCVFFIKAIQQISQYFTRFNDKQLDIYAFIFLITTIIQLSFSIFSKYIFLWEIPYIIQLLTVILIPLFLIQLIQKIELTEVPRRVKGQDHEQFLTIAASIITLLILLWFANSNFQKQIWTLASHLDLLEIANIGALILSLLVFAFLIKKQRPKYLSKFFKRLVTGLILFVFVCFLFSFQEENINSITMLLGVPLLAIISNYYLYPFLLGILMHNYFGSKKGLLLGIFMGLPYVVIAILEMFPISTIIFYYGNIIIFLVLTLCIVFIQKNKKTLVNFLRLDKVHKLENHEEDYEDPFDHLIED